jgi:hypothetical protein
LDELAPEAREEFEEHFFECAQCAQQVRDLATLRASAKVVLRERPQPREAAEPVKRRLERWLSGWWMQPGLGWAAACAMLLVATGATWQTVSLRKQMRPQAVASFVLRPETRGELTSIPAQNMGAFVLLEADLPGAAGELQWELRQANRASAVDQGVSGAPEPGASFKLLLPSSRLPAGEYNLSIRSAAGSGRPNQTWLYRFSMK